MHFADLELCTYHPGALDAAAWAAPLRAVGWLESPHPFTVGATPSDFVVRIGQLLEQTRQHLRHYRFRGAHECSLCQVTGRVMGGAGWSQENLIVPGRLEVYAAPGAIEHYIADHAYCPPPAFVEAVSTCPDCGSPEYFEALRRANGEQPPPLESYDKHARRLRSGFETTQRFLRALDVPVQQATKAQVIAAARTILPEVPFPDEAESIEVGGVRLMFDEAGRAVVE
jgi:hypothetical protein